MRFGVNNNYTKSSNQILIKLLFIALLLVLETSISIPVLSNSSAGTLLSYDIDFEDGVDDWDLIWGYNSDKPSLSLDTENSYEGDSSSRLIGTGGYRYNLSKQGKSIPFTQNTFLSFAWRIENQEGNYVGLRLATPSGEPYVFIQNLFWGTYANFSKYILKQYHDSNIGEWVSHTINLTQLFYEYYQNTPSSIEAIDVINIHHDDEQTNQITNFDSIRIWNFGQDENSQEVYFDFENDLDNWETGNSGKGFNLRTTTETAWRGNSAAQLTGTYRYRYNITKNLNSLIELSGNTTISFAWRFDNIKINYIGIGLITPADQPNLYIQNLYWGTYGNNSGYLLKQFSDSRTGKWYSHIVNISLVFQEQYHVTSTIPTKIVAIDIMNTIHTEEPTEQVTYFDSVSIRNRLVNKNDLSAYLTTSPFISLEIFICIIILVIPIRMKRKR